MFRLVCFVEDKNLAKVLHAVSGDVLNMEVPQPVSNGKVVKASNGNGNGHHRDDGAVKKVERRIVQRPEGSSMREIVITHIKAMPKGTPVPIDFVRKMIVSNGGNPTGTFALMGYLVREKVIKRLSQGEYCAA